MHLSNPVFPSSSSLLVSAPQVRDESKIKNTLEFAYVSESKKPHEKS